MLRIGVPLAIVLAASPSLAQPRSPLPHRARLTYTAPSGCPTERVFRDLVAGQTSADVFPPDAPARLVVVLARRGHEYDATAELRDRAGVVLQTRPFAPARSCSGLVQDVALFVSQQLEPHALAEQLPAPRPPPDAVDLPPPPPHVAPADPVVLRFGLGSVVGFGVAPRAAVGASADVGILWPVTVFSLEGISLSLGGLWDPPAAGTTAESAAGARASISRLLITLAPCGHAWKLFVCAVGELGQIRGVGEGVAVPAVETGAYAAVGGRAGVEVPFAPHLGFRVSGEVLGTVHAATFSIDKKPVWEAPRASGGFEAGLYLFL